MAQPQQVVDPNVNRPPTEQELLEYRVTMDRLISAFHEKVQVRGVNAYTKLIHQLKITICKYNSDLVEADEQAVLKSIKRHDGQHFKQGFVVKVRATSSREHHPDIFGSTVQHRGSLSHLQATPGCCRHILQDGRYPLQLGSHQNKGQPIRFH